MALSSMLSAIRSIILDAPSLPLTLDARISAYKRMFPALSALEIEDLSKIEPKQLAIYTRSIFSGEGDILETYFPLTLAYFQAHTSGKFSCRSLAQDLHKVFPWKSANTEGLVDNFHRYISSPDFKFSGCREFLGAFADFERDIFYARRLRNSILDPQSTLGTDYLLGLNVAEVLGLRVGLPRSARLGVYSIRVHEVRKFFLENNQALPDVLPAGLSTLSIGRPPGGVIKLREIPQCVYSLLSCKKADDLFPVSELAEHYVNSLPSGLDERAAFTKFLEFLVELMDDGVLVLLT